MKKTRVLFLCVHNAARSQMAEAFLNKYGPEFEAMSAGFEPGELNPNVVEVMRESGLDISGNKVKSVFDLYQQKLLIPYVITVCDRETAERCPVFLGVTNRLHWNFEDPSKFKGSKDEILEQTRMLRNAIEAKVKEFINTVRTKESFNKDDLI
jgi:arsenate reductase (thioredoxin)